MLLNSVIGAAKGLLRALCNGIGGIIPLPEWASDSINYILNAVAMASNLLKWVCPNELVYNSLISMAIVIVSAWLVSKIIGVLLRLYDLILV